MAELLSQIAGWEVIPTNNGIEALEKVRSVKPNLILLV